MFDLNEIKNLFVYSYQFVDDFSSIIDPLVFESEEFDSRHIKTYMALLTALFIEKGWEGDGDIGLIWIPPFIIGDDSFNGFGFHVWHVKQSNNGTSFLASPIRLKERFKIDADYLQLV